MIVWIEMCGITVIVVYHSLNQLVPVKYIMIEDIWDLINANVSYIAMSNWNIYFCRM